eukprot:Phypoly_transcript_16255.p1 GENE.Phypoly_transcript_16255~~Phypoly_transcript_16255.p1  ORF type:complete len:252 (+),score=39.35 Phypoly_transcript_16255:71-826(+)
MKNSPGPSHSIEHTLRNKELEAASRANPQLEQEFRAKYAKQNEVVEKHFDLPPSEFVLDHYSCAHYGKIPKQGRLFITPKYVLFFANILGKKVKKKIPFDVIEEIKKESVTLLAVAPIEIQLKYKRFTFVSFLHREKAFNHLQLQWKSNRDGKPFSIKIPLEDEDEHEEGEHASLSHNQAAEPGADNHIEVQSMWGSSPTTGAVLSEEPPPRESSKKSFRGTISSIPKMYTSNSGDSDKKSSCWSCFPCFR